MRTLATLILIVLIVLAAMLTMSMAFVVVCGLAEILVYVMTDSLEVGLAAGLVAQHSYELRRTLTSTQLGV